LHNGKNFERERERAKSFRERERRSLDIILPASARSTRRSVRVKLTTKVQTKIRSNQFIYTSKAYKFFIRVKMAIPTTQHIRSSDTTFQPDLQSLDAVFDLLRNGSSICEVVENDLYHEVLTGNSLALVNLYL